MGPTKRRKIHLQNQCRSRKLKYEPAEVRRIFHILDQHENLSAPAGELSVVFLEDDQIASIHEEFLNDPKATDVITFPGDPSMDFGGEICVSVDHALAFSKENETAFARELALYLVHGYLHLAGFDDLKPEAERKMREAEKQALSLLENERAVPEFSVDAGR